MLGQVNPQVDEKFRVRIPPKLREVLGAKPVITVLSPGCMSIFSQTYWEDVQRHKYEAIPRSDLAAWSCYLKISRLSSDLEFDNQGRVLLPSKLREVFGITKNQTLVMVAVGECFDVWEESALDKYTETNELPEKTVITAADMELLSKYNLYGG
ncbi:MAG: hypothetical protein LBM78_03770 [Clostridiales bacterium]|jgi:MraZ protein|nr:hypothetical protein [Clostridiales bacterium]